jgi:hypothetical protein
MKSSFKKLTDNLRTVLNHIDFDVVNHPNTYIKHGEIYCQLGRVSKCTDDVYYISETHHSITKDQVMKIIDILPLDQSKHHRGQDREFGNLLPIKSQEFLDTFNLTEEEFEFLHDQISIDPTSYKLSPRIDTVQTKLNPRFVNEFLLNKFFN